MWTTLLSYSDKEGIIHLKQYLTQQLQTKDLGHLRYFIGIEVPHLVISQRKYALDILEEIEILNVKFVDKRCT